MYMYVYTFDLSDRPTFKVILLALDFVAIFMNGLVCLVFLSQSRGLRKPQALYQINQCVIDFLLPMSMALYALIPSPRNLDSSSLPSRLICCLWLSLWVFPFLQLAYMLNFTLMAVERYFAICRPIYYQQKKLSSRRKARTAALCTWLGSLLNVVVIYSVILDPVPQAGLCQGFDLSSSPAKRAFVFALFGVTLAAVSIIPSICFLRIFKKLHKLGKQRGVVHGNAVNRAKHNFLLIVFVSFLASCASLMPSLFILLSSLFYPPDPKRETTVSTLFISLLLTKSLSTSVIYTLGSNRFRQQLLGLLRKCKRKVWSNNQIIPLDNGTL